MFGKKGKRMMATIIVILLVVSMLVGLVVPIMQAIAK
ncbi:MAG: hypothetical protein K0R15_1993 [Clostridiales bacterium]|jgi:flagellar biosynthesis protein FliQ|nr:hypothetical protein [Clostridiales bacterium]